MKKVLYINSEFMGNASDELGKILMRNFLLTLLEDEKGITEIILVNGGVKLACSGTNAADAMEEFVKNGVEIGSCGTCLDYFNLKDKLIFGKPTNMKNVVSKLSSPDFHVIRP